ncbi:unnamed protein product [Effrenium voratum]|uniref:Actin-related protein 2/3 complex subunit 4 n=1 Tax=Effrenium voratum TaxID=2562239 RepID=A0AA36IFN4_9DINO|nr:unnamed protein product [Effrenium voratum]
MRKPWINTRTTESRPTHRLETRNTRRKNMKRRRPSDRRKMLCRKFASFFTQRAEHFVVLRRKPVEGYDISFLITNTHLEEMVKERIVDFIIEFMEDVDKEIKDLKIALNTRLRAAAAAYMSQFSQRG